MSAVLAQCYRICSCPMTPLPFIHLVNDQSLPNLQQGNTFAFLLFKNAVVTTLFIPCDEATHLESADNYFSGLL